MSTAASMFYGGNVPLKPSPSILEKESAPAWVRMLQAGKLSPQNLAKITASMPEGKVRFVKNLGSGAFNVADLMAGKLKDHAGLMVRKLPQNPAVDMRLQAADALRSSRILTREHGDLVAPYLRGSGRKGLFQVFGDKHVVPNWELAHKKLQAGERLGINDIHLDEKMYAPADTDSGLLARSAARVYAPLIQRGVKDIRAANLGPGGQLIDWQMAMPGWPHRATLKGKTRLFGGAKDYIRHPDDLLGNIKALPQIVAKTPDEAHNLMQRYGLAPQDKKHNPIRQYWLSPTEEPILPPILPPKKSQPTSWLQQLNPLSWFKKAALSPDVQLQAHQQRIADRISGDDPRLLVYHGLGSGKSLSALAAAEQARQQEGGEYGVVVPASLKGNFEKEIAKFTRGSNPEVMSYTGLGMGKDFTNNPDTLIMDEAARLRNPTAASTSAAIRAAQKAKRLVLLTGTPITNEPSDIASLLSMLHNKPITPQQFDQQFVSEKKVRPGILAWLRGVKSGVKPVIKNEDKLRALLEGKVDYLPSKTPEGVNVNEEIVRVPLSAEQQRIQKAIRTKIPPGFLWKLDQEFPMSRDELAKLNSFLTGLRQVSLSTQPFRADKDMYRAYSQSSKLQKAMADLQETLKSDPRKKAIIYSNFIDAGLGPYAAALEKNKIPHAFFHGGIPVKARQQALKQYNEGKLRALLLGPAAAEGISTKGTSLIQLLDPHWNEARSQQARGRGLRFDSHEGLPEELRNVAVRRYLSASEDPGIVGKYLLGRKRERTGDEVLERLTAEKEQFNDVFRNLLREVGQEKQSDDAAPVAKKKKPAPAFTPDFTPEQLEEMGVYDSLYRGIGPRLASLGEWKPEWVNPVDPKGWAQWYKRYSGGRRLGDEDERQIKRWANFKSRHGGPFVRKPTPRRGWALQNWGIDPSLLVPEDQSDKIKTMLRDYAVKQTAKHVANTTAEQ